MHLQMHMLIKCAVSVVYYTVELAGLVSASIS